MDGEQNKSSQIRNQSPASGLTAGSQSVRYSEPNPKPQRAPCSGTPYPAYRNKNRGYQQLRVWEDARDLYVLVSRVFHGFPYELKRVASQQLASVDSVHRNIAEGYCRRSLNEYLYHLNVALGSLGESVSGLYVYRQAQQLAEKDFSELNNLAYKLENGLLRLVEALERKREKGDWIDHLADNPDLEAWLRDQAED